MFPGLLCLFIHSFTSSGVFHVLIRQSSLHMLIHMLIHALIYPLCSHVCPFIHSSFRCPFGHQYLFLPSFTPDSFIASFMHLFQDSLVRSFTQQFMGFPGGSDCKESACNAGDLGSIPGSGRSFEEGIGYPLQYSCLGNSLDRGAWRATVPGFTKSQT